RPRPERNRRLGRRQQRPVGSHAAERANAARSSDGAEHAVAPGAPEGPGPAGHAEGAVAPRHAEYAVSPEGAELAASFRAGDPRSALGFHRRPERPGPALHPLLIDSGRRVRSWPGVESATAPGQP